MGKFSDYDSRNPVEMSEKRFGKRWQDFTPEEKEHTVNAAIVMTNGDVEAVLGIPVVMRFAIDCKHGIISALKQ